MGNILMRLPRTEGYYWARLKDNKRYHIVRLCLPPGQSFKERFRFVKSWKNWEFKARIKPEDYGLDQSQVSIYKY